MGGKMEMRTSYGVNPLKERDNLDYLDIDRAGIILKKVLYKYDAWAGTGIICLRIATSGTIL
jgi:hypothetical protein